MSTETQNHWAESLPDGCPPENAFAPQNDMFYRLVDTVPPEDKDFWSHRKLFPNRKFNISECLACSCSMPTSFIGYVRRFRRRSIER